MGSLYFTAHQNLLNRQAGLGERERQLWLPTGAIAETIPRRALASNSQAITSGTLRLNGGIVLRAGEPVTSITFVAGGVGATTPTNQWFCLVDQAGNVLAKTADDTTTAWNAGAAKMLAITGAPYVPADDIAVYVGLLVVAAATPTIAGANVGINAAGVAPLMACQSTAGLTTPASLGATATIGANAVPGYAYIS